MTVENISDQPAAEPIAIAPAPASDGPINARDAMRSLVDWRNKSAAAERKETPAPDASADTAATPEPTESTAQADDAAPAEGQPSGETESQPEPAAEPLIEPPRSWTKDEKERFKTLPRETQEYLASRETERDREIRRSQNESAEQRKALDAERQKVEQARTQYESALPQLLDTLQQQQAGEFNDVKTIADVEKLAREDWPRYLQWDLAQKKIAAVAQEMNAAQQRQTSEKQTKFSEFAKREDSAFAEKVPDMGDPEKAARLQKQALNVLKDIGFSEDELGKSWNGQGDLSLRDHRVQLLVRDAIMWRDAQAKAKTATTRHVPPVQRPGAAQDKSASRQQTLNDLSKGIETKTGLNALRQAAQYVAERRRAG